MNYLFSKTLQAETWLSSAFLYYYPKTKTAKEQISYNAQAWHILSSSEPILKKGKSPAVDVSIICEGWAKLYNNRKISTERSMTGGDLGPDFLDLYQSGRRCYTIRGITLSSRSVAPRSLNKPTLPFLFVLERFVPDGLNLPAIFREWRLNRRERQIILLLIEDKSNKEVAAALRLSINTVKGYLKLLERKLNATSRCGIIARLITGKYPSL